MTKDPFEEYIRHIEADKKEKSYAWQTAIGLQEVDGLKPSQYLISTAIKNIEGEISIDTAEQWISQYYEENPSLTSENRTEEADKVSVRIAKLLSEPAFSFNANQYLAIHKYLFKGIYSHAGQIRTYNITKKEWVLEGETVVYGMASELKNTFHAPIGYKAVQGMLEKAEGRLKFSVKLHQDFSHKRTSTAEQAQAFLDALQPLRDSHCLANLFVQFPTSFERQHANRYYLAELVSWFSDYPLAIEFRHAGCHTQSVLDYFHGKKNLIWCNVDFK